MSTKTLDFKSLTTKLTTEIFNFQFSIFNFIESPGNACTKSVDCCPLSVDKYYKKLSHLAQQARVEAFFMSTDYRLQTTDYRLQSTVLVYAHLWTKSVAR